MINVLYVGNYLKGSKNPSYMFTLGPLLEGLGCRLTYTSSANNKVLRLLGMLRSVVHCRRYVDVVLIDTYSTQNFYYAYLCSQLCRFFKLKYIIINFFGIQNCVLIFKNYPKNQK